MKVLATAWRHSPPTLKCRYGQGSMVSWRAWHAPRLQRLQRLPDRPSPALHGGITKPLERLLSSVSPTSRLTAAERAFGRRSMVRAPVLARVRLCGASASSRLGQAGRRSYGCIRAHAVRPNPSLEWTCTGMALGPRGVVVHHPPRGPSTTPAPAPQLKR